MSDLQRALAAGLLRCPTCGPGTADPARLGLSEVYSEEAGAPLHGFLACPACPARYPLVDGVVVLSSDVAGDLRREARPLWSREDLPGPLASYLHQAYSDEEDPNWRRQMLAVYGRDLPGEPAPRAEGPLSDALHVAAAETRAAIRDRIDALALATPPEAWALDLGCGVGWSSLALAERLPVVALDRDLGVLRILGQLLRRGESEVPAWRHGGADFVPRRVSCERPPQPVVLVLGDALQPPFPAGAFHLLAALNLLDNVSAPLKLLQLASQLLASEGRLLLSSPYEWSSRATPPEARLGESIREGDSPDPAAALRALLAAPRPELGLALQLEREVEDLPWVLERHKRSVHVYWCHLVEARRVAASG